MTNKVSEYVSARIVTNAVDADTTLHQEAVRIMERLGPQEVAYTFACMLCGAELDHTVTVAEAADFTGAPRGICGRH
jgi:hypothetical protein